MTAIDRLKALADDLAYTHEHEDRPVEYLVRLHGSWADVEPEVRDIIDHLEAQPERHLSAVGVLRALLEQDAPHGWESYLVGEPASCWFDSARNAAAWVCSQDPERIGTPYEYKVRPTPAPRVTQVDPDRTEFGVPGGRIVVTLTTSGVSIMAIADQRPAYADALILRPTATNMVAAMVERVGR